MDKREILSYRSYRKPVSFLSTIILYWFDFVYDVKSTDRKGLYLDYTHICVYMFICVYKSYSLVCLKVTGKKVIA